MAEEKSIWQRVKGFVHDIIYVSDDEEETEAPVKQEQTVTQPAEEPHREEVREEISQPEVIPQPVEKPITVEKPKPAETVASINRDNRFITIDRKAAEPAEEEKKPEMNKVVSTFRRVEIISPVGPSNKFNNNVQFDTKPVREEKSEYKPIVNIINTMGPQVDEVRNDDIDSSVAALSVDDFTGYKPAHAVEEAAPEAAQLPEEKVSEPVAETVVEPVSEPLREEVRTEPVVSEPQSRQSAYIRDFSDVFHTSSQDVIVEEKAEEKKEPASIGFNIPVYLSNEEEKKNISDTGKYENLSLFDFLEDDK